MNRHHNANSLIHSTDDIPAHMRSPGPAWAVLIGMIVSCAVAFVLGAWAAFTMLTGF